MWAQNAAIEWNPRNRPLILKPTALSTLQLNNSISGRKFCQDESLVEQNVYGKAAGRLRWCRQGQCHTERWDGQVMEEALEYPGLRAKTDTTTMDNLSEDLIDNGMEVQCWTHTRASHSWEFTHRFKSHKLINGAVFIYIYSTAQYIYINR